MSQKEKVMGMGMLCASVGLFYLAINFWVQPDSNVVKAITIDYETESGNWSGYNKPDFYVNSPGLTVTFPPPPRTGDGGH